MSQFVLLELVNLMLKGRRGLGASVTYFVLLKAKNIF